MWQNGSRVSKVAGNFSGDPLDGLDPLFNITGEHAAGGAGEADGGYRQAVVVQDGGADAGQPSSWSRA